MFNRMNFITKSILACCMLLFTSVMAFAQYPEGSPVGINGKLRIENGQLVNECGTPVQLRGMSSHGLAWNPDAYNESSIKALVEDWNISVFRIAVYTHEWGGYTTGQWRTREQYHEIIDNLVDLCGKYGIYCLIDWHVLNGGSGNPNNTLTEATYFWEYMAKKHRESSHVLYEICNEPNGGSVSWYVVKKYADTIIPIIRKIDPYTIIICGTPTWSQDVDKAARSPLEYSNIMYTLHFYSGTHGRPLRDKADEALSRGAAIFVTEFGISKADGGKDGNIYTESCDYWMDWMNEHNISWCNWSFSDKEESSAALNKNAVRNKDWNNVSASGAYIKSKLAEPYKDSYVQCDEHFDPELPEICDTCNAVEDINNDVDVIIYPNPMVDNAFSIEAPFEVEKVIIYDMDGKEVERYDIPNTNYYITHNLREGVYQVKIYGSKFITVKKLIKK